MVDHEWGQFHGLATDLTSVTSEPLAAETQFLTLLNAARADPPAYGRKIGVNLNGVAPSRPLRMDARLVTSARSHSKDMAARRYFGHTGAGGLSPGQRMQSAGVNVRGWAESIAAGNAAADQTLAQLIRDQGVPSLGHRKHLLSIGSPYNDLPLVGVGYAAGGPYGHYWTVDSANDGKNGPTGPTPQPQPPPAPQPRRPWWRRALDRLTGES